MRKFYGRNNYRRGKAKGIYTPKGLENKIKLWVLRGIESYNLYDNLKKELNIKEGDAVYEDE